MVPKELSPYLSSFRVVDPDDSIWIAKEWIQERRSCHHKTCENTARKHPMSLKVIDRSMRELRILRRTALMSASAMSGVSRQFVQDKQGGSANLPRSMEDATYVISILGMRYLWVDRYCIDQANDAEKYHAISHMDVIYQDATVTIIAAAGDRPHAGLPGIRGTPCAQ
ncbi:HET-domain-containing protein [Macroventuria anomochaeta]|uniref:HET-domain-containing protein n=1 Tax=Macroventuria anomochaeta TaxID=301207 RepID=A0ACB6RLK4_9PLEO|nr:HET-domain-containing protein [Macroventuria anomochaeta]KAF2621983.1 HET-domain-containing protein [Macroventuria anomochaeta]